MSLVIASSALTTGFGTLTTGSFTPPDGSIVVVAFSGNSTGGFNPSAPTITDSLGSHLPWSLANWRSRADGSPTVDGQCAIWTAVVGTGAAMTVTVTCTSEGALYYWVITGQDTSPVGAHGEAASASASAISQNYTAQATSGQGFGVVCDWDFKGNETAGTGCTMDATGNVGSQFTYGFVHRTADDDSNGAANAINVNLPGTSTNLNWCWIEILPVPPNPDLLDPPPITVPPHILYQLMMRALREQELASQAIQVTATEGGSTFNGIALTVKVLTGAAAVQNGTHNNTTNIATPSLAITPTATGSVVYGSLTDATGATSWTTLASSTFAQNFVDGTNGATYGLYRSASTTTAGTPVTLGASAPTARGGGLAQVEILAAGTLAEDASSPAGVTNTAGITVTTAQFTPPPGSLLVAMVGSDSNTGVATMTVSGGGLTWTEVDKANAAGLGYAGVWIAQVPGGTPAVPSIVIQTPHRRLLLPRLRPGSRSSGPVPAQVVVAPPGMVLQPAHIRLKPAWLAPRRPSQPVPVQVAVTPPAFPPPAARPRPRPASLRRRPPPAVPPDQPVAVQAVRPRLKLPNLRLRRPVAAVPADQAGPVQAPRGRVRLPRLGRGRQAAPVPPQVAVPPVFPPQTPRSRLKAIAARRRATSQPVADQAAVVAPQRVRPRLARLWRGRQAAPVPPQATVTPPAYPPQAVKPRARLWWSFRGRQVTPVPPQVVVTAPAYPPATGRSRAKYLRPPRPRAAVPVPAQVAVTPPAFVPQVQRVRARLGRLFHSRTAAPVPVQTPVVPPFVPARSRPAPVRAVLARRPRVTVPPAHAPVPLVTRVKLKVGRLLRGKPKPVVPPQAFVINPPYPPQFSRPRLRFWPPRHRAAPTPVPTHSCSTPRPGTGVTPRPGTGTTVYNTATTGRPSTGITLRPNTGTTEDPC